MMDHLPLVGRQYELTQVHRHLAAAVTGKGGALLVGGEAGAGKTVLLTAAREAATGLVPVSGRCAGPGETPPFGPWLEVVADLRRQAGCDPDLLPPPFGSAAGDGNAHTVGDLLAGWLVQANQPLLVAIEDIHWADPASLDLLGHLIPRLGRMPVLLLTTYRTDEVHRTHPLWSLLPDWQRAGATRLLLERLTADDVTKLASAALPGVPGTLEFARWLHQRTGGNALFVRELLAEAARVGQVPAWDRSLPQTLQQAIDRSLARLTPEAQSVLQAAAILGERFSYDLLVRVVEVGEGTVTAALEEAVKLQIVRGGGTAREHFAFAHALVREALVNRLIVPRRRRRHARVAEVLLAAPYPDLDAVALHLERAGDPRAVSYLLAAGDRSLRLGALTQAGQHYERALELLPGPDPRRAELLLKRGDVVRVADPERGCAYWEEAIRAAELAGDRPVAVWGRFHIAWLLSVQDDPRSLALMAAVQAEQEELLGDPRYQQLEIDQFGEVAGYPRMAAFHAMALASSGRLTAARALTAEMYARVRPGSGLAHLLQVGCILAWNAGRLDDAARLIVRLGEEQVQRRQFRLATWWEVQRLHLLLFHQADQPADIDGVAERVARWQTIAEGQIGHTLAEGYSLLGPYQFLRGDWDAARVNLLDYLQHHPDPKAIDPLYRWFAACLQVALGDVDGARVSLSDALVGQPEDRPGFDRAKSLVLVYTLGSQLHLAAREPEAARTCLEAIDRWLQHRPQIPQRAHVRLAWAEFHRQAGRISMAGREARQALVLAEEAHDCWQVIRTQRLLCELAAQQARNTEAARHLQAALVLAERCRFPYELALTQLVRARFVPEVRGGADDLTAACDTLARLGAAPALAAARAALKKTQR